MEVDVWVLLLTVLFLDYELSICIVWFAIIRCFDYRMVELVSGISFVELPSCLSGLRYLGYYPIYMIYIGLSYVAVAA
jgi:hypothetical protein